MRGFTKDGKFRPTGKRNKSALSKDDFVLFNEPYNIKRKVPTHVEMSRIDNKLPPNTILEGGAESIRDYWNDKNLRRRKDESIEDFHKRCKQSLDKEQYNPNKEYLVASGKWWRGLSEKEKKKFLDEHAHMKGNHVLDDGTPTTPEKDEIHDWYLHGEFSDFPPHLWGTIERGYIDTQLKHQESRDKQTIGSHAGHPLVIEDNGKLYEEFSDHDEEVFRQPNAIDKHRNKFSLFGNKKSDQAKASEERIKNEEQTQKILEKQDKVQDKNNQKRAKEIAHHIKFLEKHMEGLEKKPAKFGVNASTQLENLQESRDQKRDLQAELDEINQLLEHPQVRHKKGIGKFTNQNWTQELEDNPHSSISAREFDSTRTRDKNTLKGISETELHDALGHAGIDPSGAIGNYPESHLRGIVENYRKSMNEPRAKVVHSKSNKS